METKIEQLKNILENRKEAISRKNLAYALDMTDRQMRKLIELARLNDIPVIPDLDNGGYMLARTADEIARFTATMRSRAINELRIAKAMEDGFKEREQGRLF